MPVSDDPIRTQLATSEGELAFQDYFVRRRCEPRVHGNRLPGRRGGTPRTGCARGA